MDSGIGDRRDGYGVLDDYLHGGGVFSFLSFSCFLSGSLLFSFILFLCFRLFTPLILSLGSV